VVEYALLLAMHTGTSWLERVRATITGDPVVLWGAVAAGVVLVVWLVKPRR